MNELITNAMSSLSEGVILIDEHFKVIYINSMAKKITCIQFEDEENINILEKIPGLNKKYIIDLLYSVLNRGTKNFFSAALHKDFFKGKRKINIKISRLKNKDRSLIFIELIDVTNQFMEINQLKNNLAELKFLNKVLKEKEKTIHELAFHDTLTGLANRTLFYNIAEKLLNNSRRNNDLLGLIFIDIDKFKDINDTLGHKTGDEVLKNVARLLNLAVRDEDVVSRFGGDEFLILLPGLSCEEDVKIISTRILNSPYRCMLIDKSELYLSFSLGASFFPKSGQSIDELITTADEAMYISKKNGGNFCYLHNITELGHDKNKR